jgi:hypothetical protein
MASNVQIVKDMQIQQLRDLLVSKVVDLGCACAPDLAGQIGSGIKPVDLIPVLEDLVKDGVLRHMKRDPRDRRDYAEPYQTVYELAR